MAIRSFKTKGLEKLFTTGKFHKHVPIDLRDKLTLLLDQLNAASIKKDLNIPRYNFHELKGKRKGTYAWNVTANQRLTFRFEDGDAFDVSLEDYH